ncbi:unnamed protein product [Lactuca virosa]|uniref:Uncharacterized protein n=1 Tax=Lactuca virosa TaxID=75947 RepID=A0AAU9PBC2_9ASTR|nr:unnamed protein product [Lactuca virosa]
MYLLNEVSLRTKAHSEELYQCQVVFDEALEGLKQLWVLHEQTKKEAKELKEEVLSEQKVATCQAKVDQGAEELRWDVREGIPLFVRALLDSSDFGTVNATMQTSAIQLDLHQACVDMKEKYPEELKDKSVLYSYPDAQC